MYTLPRLLVLPLAVLLGCGEAGPKSEAQAKAAIEARLSERYGAAFSVASVRHQARGLDGYEADRHSFEAYPDDAPANSFEGLVDFDEGHESWTDTWPCIRDAEAMQAALDEALAGLKVQRSESRCADDLLAEADPTTPGAAFVWTAQVTVFGAPEQSADQDAQAALLAANTPIHTKLTQAATTNGPTRWAWQVDRYTRGKAFVDANGDAPLSPAMQMWFEGSTVSSHEVETEVSRFDYRATGVEADLRALAEQHLPPTGELSVVVRSNERSRAMVKQSPDMSLADVPPGQLGNLVGILALTVQGSPEVRGPAVRDWMTHLHQSLPKDRFSPSTYIAFYDDDTDPDRSRGLQPDKQGTVWLVNSGVGIRVRSQTMDDIQPITAIRYVVPGDAP